MAKLNEITPIQEKRKDNLYIQLHTYTENTLGVAEL